MHKSISFFASKNCLLLLCADAYDPNGLQEVQLEDGSTAYIQHTVHMPQSNTILAIQADGTIADLQAEATALDPDTISVLEQYTTKVNAVCYLFSGTERPCDMARSLPLLNIFPSSLQVENIENPLSTYSRVEPDNGVHMRVRILNNILLNVALFLFTRRSLACLRLCCRIRTTGR